MISDVTLSALANWLGSLTMILIVLYHVSCFVVLGMILPSIVLTLVAKSISHCNGGDLTISQALSVNVKRNQETTRRVAAST